MEKFEFCKKIMKNKTIISPDQLKLWLRSIYALNLWSFNPDKRHPDKKYSTSLDANPKPPPPPTPALLVQWN